MKKIKILILSLLAIFLASCVNPCGVSLNYYDNKKEDYDISGKYIKEYESNFINWCSSSSSNSASGRTCLQCK